MLNRDSSVVPVREIIGILHHYRWRWIVPACTIFTITLGYAAIRPSTWQASQALLVRDEAIGENARPGRFSHLDEMKTVQETILEVVKTRDVAENALKAVGIGTSSDHQAAWPDVVEIDKIRGAISLSAPNGAEFGRTEVLHLSVKDCDRQRAIELAEAVFKQLDRRFREVRDQRAHGLVDELAKTVTLAESDLTQATNRVAEIEKRVGQDLGELRILSEASSGESNLRRAIIEVENELRQARISHRANTEMLSLLRSALDNPEQLVVTPNHLLESQPALRQLRDGLVEAQLTTSRLLGGMSSVHPEVVAARDTENAVREHIHAEVDVAIRNVQAELRLGAIRTTALEQELAALQNRVSCLAENRAVYQNLLREVEQRREILGSACAELAEARASRATARSTSLISALGQPETGTSPLGPGRTTIALAGLLGGILSGIGIVFLTAQPVHAELSREQTHSAPSAAAPTARPSFPASLLDLTGGLGLKHTLMRLYRRTPSPN